ncbi:MAG: GNAT family N-acetyltransferase [Sedimentisphaerales bacterium]|nr:GNAT family N-acetyltransferase [Sedimentisphaerales bacterium]
MEFYETRLFLFMSKKVQAAKEPENKKEKEMEFKTMKITDYEEVFALWQSCPGIGLHSDIDSKLWIGMYLARNPGISFVAVLHGQDAHATEKIVGAVLCGHDGRRGYLHHLAVAEGYRHKGIGKALLEKAFEALRNKGIRKCHTFVFCDNEEGLGFWQNSGFAERKDLKLVSKKIML